MFSRLSADQDDQAPVGANKPGRGAHETGADTPQVVQEGVLARTSLCHWGDVQISLDDILRVTLWLLHKIRYVKKSLNDSPGLASAIMMLTFHDLIVGPAGTTVHLHSMLEASRYFLKTEPRDTLYAVLGLWSRNKDPELCAQARKTLLKVDYTKPVADLMQDASRYSFIELGHMMVYRRCLGDEEQNLASWAIRAETPSAMAKENSNLPSFTCACRGLEPAFQFHDTSYGNEVLLTQGFFVDSVADITVSCDGMFKRLENYYLWLIQAKHAVQRNYERRGEQLSEQIDFRMAWTLAAGEGPFENPAKPTDFKIFTAYIRDCETFLVNEKIREQRNIEFQSNVQDDTMGSLRCSVQRRFFMTSEGLMGLGPGSMRIDDHIVIIRGAIRPVVLRKTTEGSRYILVGEAYVYGIMDGEAVEEWKAQGEIEQLFPLV